VWKLQQSSRVSEVICTPGNAGITEIARCIATDGSNAALVALAIAEAVAFTVVGPEVPLVAGLVDAFQAAGLRIFGPSQAAAQIEGSKAFAKALMQQCQVPTAAFSSLNDQETALRYLEHHSMPVVIKDSGLAAGKGVTIAHSYDEAVAAVQAIFAARHGAATVVIEEFLHGEEVSIHAICDGQQAVLLLPAQDHKQLHDHDQGPMTGGMGVYCPFPLSESIISDIQQQVIAPILAGMRANGTPFVGFLYPGLMLTNSGIKVLEFNCRFGDPETQAILPLLENDLVEVLEAAMEQRLHEITLHWRPLASACVVMAAPGYPEAPQSGIVIEVPDPAPALVFHAGTKRDDHGTLRSNGGRVLSVVGTGDTLEAALAQAYTAVATIEFAGGHYRRDIGRRTSVLVR
jgi:phosphoribosylamine---glycine ligase